MEDVDQVEIEAERIIASVKTCVERGEGKGKCHVFLNSSDRCECGAMDLSKYRMK